MFRIVSCTLSLVALCDISFFLLPFNWYQRTLQQLGGNQFRFFGSNDSFHYLIQTIDPSRAPLRYVSGIKTVMCRVPTGGLPPRIYAHTLTGFTSLWGFGAGENVIC